MQDTLELVEQALNVENPADFLAIVQQQQLKSRLRHAAQQAVPDSTAAVAGLRLGITVDTHDAQMALSSLQLLHDSAPEAPKGLTSRDISDSSAGPDSLVHVEDEAGEDVVAHLVGVLAFLALGHVELSEEVEGQDSVDVADDGE